MAFKGMKILLGTLVESDSKISRLDFSNNQLDDDCMKLLGEYIQDTDDLESIALNRNKISDKAIVALSEYLIGNTGLKSFLINDNPDITDASVPYIIEIVNRSHIEYIDESGSQISTKGSKMIRDALSIPIDQREIPIKSNTKSASKNRKNFSIP